MRARARAKRPRCLPRPSPCQRPPHRPHTLLSKPLPLALVIAGQALATMLVARGSKASSLGA